MTFEEYLKSQGASDDDIKAIATPIARKAFEALQARMEAAETGFTETKTKMDAYQAKVDEYYTTTNKTATEMRDELITAKAKLASATTALQEAHKRGMIDVAKDLGWNPEEPPKKVEPKFVTAEEIMPAIDQAGEGLAAVYDAAAEHARLFPDVPFSARDIRREAVAARKSFYDYWESKYKVPDARAAFEAKRKEAYETKLRAEGAAAERAKFASEYGNPNTRPPMPSNSPFVIRKNADGSVQQPWGRSEEQNSDARVRKGTEALLKRQETGVH